MVREAFEPPELVIEFRTGCRIAVRQIHARNQNAIENRLDVPAMKVIRIPRQPSTVLVQLTPASQDGNSVPTFLAVPNRAVSSISNRGCWKLLLGGFQLL